jgi:hypothetical protein
MDCNDQYGTQEDRKGVSEEGSGRSAHKVDPKKALQVVLHWQIPYLAQFGKVGIPPRSHIGEFISAAFS